VAGNASLQRYTYAPPAWLDQLSLSFKFTAHSSKKADGTAITLEHRTFPLVVGAGNADM
jgi:hypothetical protein